jgi:hypothetical protein
MQIESWVESFFFAVDKGNIRNHGFAPNVRSKTKAQNDFCQITKTGFKNNTAEMKDVFRIVVARILSTEVNSVEGFIIQTTNTQTTWFGWHIRMVRKLTRKS